MDSLDKGEFQEQEIQTRGVKIILSLDSKPVARAFVYFIRNDLHSQPYALLEDIFVEENMRGKGLGSKIVEKAIKVAKRAGCYKMIACSRYQRHKVHKFYLKLGFVDYGREFRLNFDQQK